jgi:alpha-beta hydrolase superfamily lysophospholipase
MGATVGLLALRRRALAPAAVVLVSPMLRLPLPVPEGLARLAAKAARLLDRGRSFAPGEAGRTEVMGAMPSEAADEACRLRVLTLAEAHTDLVVRGTTWGWGCAALTAMPRARKASWTGGPALVVTASDERSVDLSPVPALCRRLHARHLELEGGHDLFLSAPEARERLHAAIAATVEPALATRGAGR